MVKLDPQLVDELADSAADAQESMDQTVNRLLRLAIQVEGQDLHGQRQPEEGKTTPALRWHIVPAGAPAPSFDPANRNYLDLLAEDS
jgi:hypothetical protein